MFATLLAARRRREARPPSRSPGAALLTAVAAGSALLLTSASLFGASAAVAGPLDSSSARAQFLSGSLLTGIDLSGIAEIGGSSAVNDGSPSDVIDVDDLNLSVLGDVLTIDIGGGLQVPIAVADAGVLGQYALAQDDGSSFAATGLVGDSGIIGVGPVPGDPPGPLTFDLSDVIGGALAAELAELQVEVGAATASAEIVNAGAPVGGYSIAGLDLSLESAALAEVSSLVLDTVAVVDDAVDALGGLDAGLSVPGVAVVEVDVAVDVEAVVAELVGPSVILGGGGPVEIALGTGGLTIDYDQLLGLNGLDPSTELLSSEVLTLVLDEVAVLLDSLSAGVITAVDTAVAAAEVDILLEGLFVLGAPTVSLLLTGTLQDVLDGSLDGGALAGLLNTLLLVLQPAVEAIIGPDGLVADLGTDLSSTLTPVVTSLDGSLDLLSEALSLLVNVQESSAGVFTETALRVTLLQALGGAGAAQLDLAQAEVGPNVDLLDVDPPAVTALDPGSGPETGGTEVTITGTGLTDATDVDFGGAAAAIVSSTDTELVVTTGARAPGLVDVTVTTPSGSDVLVDGFTYLAVVDAPQILALDPIEGPATGGTEVTITGTGLADATDVDFGGAPAAIVSSTDTELVVTTGAGAPGLVDVTVTTPGGTDVLVDGFTYVAVVDAPEILAIDPIEGPETGGTEVTITGTGLADASAVDFGGAAAAIVSNTDTELVVTTGARAPGLVDVAVTTLGGTDVLVDAFTYLAVVDAPEILAIDPIEGPETGGTEVTITGTGLADASAVDFGGAAASILSNTDTALVVVTGARAPGLVDVTVTTPGGTDVLADAFTYLAVVDAPEILAIDPIEGPAAGGTEVTITGTGLDDATAVDFGGAPAAIVSNTDTELVVTTSARAPGLVDVSVTTPGGTDVLEEAFTYLEVVEAPEIESLDPISGPETGGTEVTITGTGLADATAVDFGGAAATIVSSTDTELVVTTGARAPGLVDVTLTTPGGVAALEDAFTFTPVLDDATTIIGVAPDEGPENGGTEVTITGVCFTGATAVLFGDVEGASFEVVSDTVITAVTAPGSGVVDVTVIGSVDCGEDTADDAFSFVPGVVEALAVESLAPVDGPETGGTLVTITGTGFAEATSVDFGGAAAVITSATDTELTVLTSAREPGLVEVTVTTPAESDVLEDAFTYTPIDDRTEIVVVEPDRGPEGGGTVVTITGSCFTGASAVLFGSTPARSVTVVNDTTIRAVAPAGTGLVDVTVVGSSDCGSATDDDAFRYIQTGGSLPVTGFEGMWLTGVGGLLLLGGAVLLALRRRAG